MYTDPFSLMFGGIVFYTGIECGLLASIAHFGEDIIKVKPKQAAIYGASRYLITGASIPMFGLMGSVIGYHGGKIMANSDPSIEQSSSFVGAGAGFFGGMMIGTLPSYGIGIWGGRKIAFKHAPPMMPWKSILILEGAGIISKMTLGYMVSRISD
jgi:hypothetical protein